MSERLAKSVVLSLQEISREGLSWGLVKPVYEVKMDSSAFVQKKIRRCCMGDERDLLEFASLT